MPQLICVVADKTVTIVNMNKKYQVVLNLRNQSVPDKIVFTKTVASSLTNNPNFPNPVPSIVDILASATALEASYEESQKARDVAVTKTAIKNQKEEAHDFIMTALGSYVEVQSKGDEAKIKSAGMDVKAGATPIGIPDTPAALAASEGAKTGVINLKWKTVRGAKSYVVRLTDAIADGNSWKQSTVVTKATAVIDGLSSGKQYWFQAAAVGAAGQGAWSDPAVKVAP